MRALITLLALVTLSATGFAQRYELIEPSGRVTGTAEALRGRLLVRESTGERIYFSRELRYDSADGRLLGYWNVELNRVLRFPRSGSGLMQLADLDDAAPRFRDTRRTVRPLGDARRLGFDLPSRGSLQAAQPFGAPYVSGYRFPRFQQSLLLDSQTIPNPPIPPATLQLANSGPRELQVTVVDLQDTRGTRKLRIAPRQITEVKVERDPGANLVQNFRTITPYGESITREIVTPIPPPLRYEIVVHEWAMQSIAIDRTGKSPSVIEDVNFQGRGLGRFPLPPGAELQSGQIDVYTVAGRAGNAGTVAPLTQPNVAPTGNATALERAILEIQQRDR